jgi:hypothetical protein
MLFTEPRDSWPPLQRPIASDLIPILDVRW